MYAASRPLEPTDRLEVLAVLGAMQRQIALLGYHVKELRNDGGVTEEVNGGLAVIDDALKKMRKLPMPGNAAL